MKPLKIFNTYSGQVEKFIPFRAPYVTMYVCGVTPYDTSHLGHAFVFTFFDVVKRFLKYSGYKLTYVQNVTDIDDPLIERAKELDMTWQDLAKKWTDYLLNDFQFLHIQMPDHYIKATEEVGTMIKIIAQLLKDKYAYTRNGNIYYSIKKFSRYGEL